MKALIVFFIPFLVLSCTTDKQTQRSEKAYQNEASPDGNHKPSDGEGNPSPNPGGDANPGISPSPGTNPDVSPPPKTFLETLYPPLDTTKSGTIENKPNLSVIPNNSFVARSIGSHVFAIFNGKLTAGEANAMHLIKINPDTAEIEDLTSALPAKLNSVTLTYAATIATDQELYVLFGIDSGSVDRNFAINPFTKTSREISKPGFWNSTYGLAYGAWASEYLYFVSITGTDANGTIVKPFLFSYHIPTTTWTMIDQNAPTSRRANLTPFWDGKEFFAFGGQIYTNNNPTNIYDAYAYSPTNQAWRKVLEPNSSCVRRLDKVYYATPEKLLVMFGKNPNGTNGEPQWLDYKNSTCTPVANLTSEKIGTSSNLNVPLGNKIYHIAFGTTGQSFFYYP